MKRILLFFAAIAAVLAPAWVASAQSPLPGTLIDVRYDECPIMGGKVKAEVATLHEGKVYHFCCPSCIEEFRKNPEAAIAKIKTPTDVPLKVTNSEGKCPVSGSTAKSELFLVRGDAVTFYCCKGCIGSDTLPPGTEPVKALESKTSTVPASGAACGAACGTAGGKACGAEKPKAGATCGPDGVCK